MIVEFRRDWGAGGFVCIWGLGLFDEGAGKRKIRCIRVCGDGQVGDRGAAWGGGNGSLKVL